MAVLLTIIGGWIALAGPTSGAVVRLFAAVSALAGVFGFASRTPLDVRAVTYWDEAALYTIVYLTIGIVASAHGG